MSVSTCDPLQLDNLATCFRCYNADALAIKTYLLCQTLSIATPPCVTPSTPTSTGFKSKTDTTIRISWFQPANSGSLITSYTIKWGTVTGVYTNSATVGISPKLYTITGLTQGTQYFWVIQANSFAGCSSANSAESNATTSGASPTNGLLNGLISYWKFDVNVSPYADSFGGNPLTGSGTSAGVVPGIINGGLDVSGGGAQASHVSNADFMPVAGVDLSLAAWISSSDWTVGGTGTFPSFLQKGDNATLNSYGFGQVRASNRIYAYLADSSTFQQTLLLTPGAPTPNVYHQIVMTWDATAKLLSVYFDGAFVTSALLTTNQIVTGAQAFIAGPGIGFASWLNLRIDEMALWHKPLNATDVTNIFNGGACLPFSSYQA